MRRAVPVLLPALAVAAGLFAQHAEAPAGGAAHGGSAEHSDSSAAWKWANFALLAAGLGYLIRKKAQPFFALRDREIRLGIEQAAALRAQAEARAGEIERKLANLSAEIELLRAAAREEMEVEAGRMRRETELALHKIQEQADQEIASAVKAARMELRRHAVELAVRTAGQRLRAGLTTPVDEGLVRSFVEDLGRRGWPAGGEAH